MYLNDRRRIFVVQQGCGHAFRDPFQASRRNAHNTNFFQENSCKMREALHGMENKKPSPVASSTTAPDIQTQQVNRKLLEHDKVIRYLVEQVVVPERNKSQKVRLEFHPIVFASLILILTLLIGFSIKVLSTSQANETRLTRVIDTISMKYPELRIEAEILRTHQDLASAPVYWVAKLLTFLFGQVSASFIMIIDKTLKLIFSCVLVSAIAYLFLKRVDALSSSDTDTSDPVRSLLKLLEPNDTLAAAD
jgi:hypothetical protein